MISYEQKVKFILRFAKKNLNILQRTRYMKKLVEDCKKVKYCPKCNSIQGTVKRILGQNLKVCHVKWKNFKFESKDSKKSTGDALEPIDQIELDEIKVKTSDS